MIFFGPAVKIIFGCLTVKILFGCPALIIQYIQPLEDPIRMYSMILFGCRLDDSVHAAS